MHPPRTVVLLLLAPLLALAVVVSPAPKDSYLQALQVSKILNADDDQRRDDAFPVYSRPDYAGTVTEFQPNREHRDYLPPSSYFPAEHYSDAFGPYPAAKPIYGPPPQYGPPPSMMMMEHGKTGSDLIHWILGKFKIKFDIVTIAKIVLKLLIFKKFVKFFGIICMLFVLPWLQKKFMGKEQKIKKKKGGKGDEEEDEDMDLEMRMMKDANASTLRPSQLNQITRVVTRALETFAIQNFACSDEATETDPYCYFSSIYRRLQAIEEPKMFQETTVKIE